MKIAHVKFNNPEYNYSTKVNKNISDDQIRAYFVGNHFNIGVEPDNMQQCINVIIEERDEYNRNY